MSGSIVERLRELASFGLCCDVDMNETCDEAADTIECLLEALEEALATIWQYKNDLHYPPSDDSMGRRLARASEVATQIERAIRQAKGDSA